MPAVGGGGMCSARGWTPKVAILSVRGRVLSTCVPFCAANTLLCSSQFQAFVCPRFGRRQSSIRRGESSVSLTCSGVGALDSVLSVGDPVFLQINKHAVPPNHRRAQSPSRAAREP